VASSAFTTDSVGKHSRWDGSLYHYT